MGKNFTDYLLRKYDLNQLFYTKGIWNELQEVENFNVVLSQKNFRSKSYEYKEIKTNKTWNGKTQKLKDFNIKQKRIELVDSDYYTQLIRRKCINNSRSERRERLIFDDELILSGSFGVNCCILLEIDSNLYIIYHKRSNEVNVTEGLFSSIPNGGFERRHSSISKCLEEEMSEELLGNNYDNLYNIKYDVYYSGFGIDVKSCSSALTSIIYISGENAIEFLRNIRVSRETENLFIENAQNLEEKIFDEINVYNSSPSGLYCIKRAIEEKENISSEF